MRAFHHHSVEISSISKKKNKTQNSLLFVSESSLFFSFLRKRLSPPPPISPFPVPSRNLWFIYLLFTLQVLVATHGVLALCWGTVTLLIVACKLLIFGMWSLVPWPGIEPGPPALGAQSLNLNHWAAREVPRPCDLNDSENSSKTC